MVNAKEIALGVVGILVVFQLLAALMPEAQTSGDALCDSGVPLGGLFKGSGVVFVLIMAGILFAVIGSYWKSK